MNILRVDSSALSVASRSRALTDRVVASLTGLATGSAPARIVTRDLSTSLPHVDEAWVVANYTPEEMRTPAQRDVLALSDALIDEVLAADILVIGLPVYNFGLPASLKAWVDLVCRARKTFQFTESGPVGLIRGKTAVVVYVSSGTPMGSPIDHASGHLRLLLNFIGLTDVRFVAAGMHLTDPGCLITAGEVADRIGAELAEADALVT